MSKTRARNDRPPLITRQFIYAFSFFIYLGLESFNIVVKDCLNVFLFLSCKIKAGIEH